MKSLNTWGYDMNEKWIDIAVFIVGLSALAVVIYELSKIAV